MKFPVMRRERIANDIPSDPQDQAPWLHRRKYSLRMSLCFILRDIVKVVRSEAERFYY